MKSKKLTFLILIAVYVGCASGKIPQYSIIGPKAASEPIVQAAQPVKSGWEFQLPVTARWEGDTNFQSAEQRRDFVVEKGDLILDWQQSPEIGIIPFAELDGGIGISYGQS